jgi:hypothetical protein
MKDEPSSLHPSPFPLEQGITQKHLYLTKIDTDICRGRMSPVLMDSVVSSVWFKTVLSCRGKCLSLGKVPVYRSINKRTGRLTVLVHEERSMRD